MKTLGTRVMTLLTLSLGYICVMSTAASANSLNNALVTANCSSYSITVQAIDLNVGNTYTISWTLTATPTGGGSPVSSSHSITFQATSATYTQTLSENWSMALNGDYTLAGTAELVGANSGPIRFPDNFFLTTFSLTGCAGPPPPPPPPACTVTGTNQSNFNGTQVAAGAYLWFNANFKASNIPSGGVTIDFTNGNIAFTAGGTPYSIPVPNAKITFSPSASCTSTTFDTATMTWITTVPLSGDDEIFLTGVAWPVPSPGLAGGANPVNFSGTYSAETSAPGLSLQMEWSVAAYSKFTTNYNQLNIKAGHQTACGQNNGDHAGTPEGEDNSNVLWKSYLVGGPRGGGGSNFTGSWSGQLTLPVCSK